MAAAGWAEGAGEAVGWVGAVVEGWAEVAVWGSAGTTSYAAALGQAGYQVIIPRIHSCQAQLSLTKLSTGQTSGQQVSSQESGTWLCAPAKASP